MTRAEFHFHLLWPLSVVLAVLGLLPAAAVVLTAALLSVPATALWNQLAPPPRKEEQ